jgi:predicted acylesterase/phospholipase RssA
MALVKRWGDGLEYRVLWRIRSAVVSLLAGVAVSGCAATIVRHGIADPQLAVRANVAGLPNVRFWGDDVPVDVRAAMQDRLPYVSQLTHRASQISGRPLIETLALSGGGQDGAFGAGLLTGWSERGDRPEFEVVTGVSAGAIIAPFAFLGPAYDRQLKEIWTQYRTSELITPQILPGLLGGSALADTSRLAQLMETYVDAKLLRAIAAEYRRGRVLTIGTTNLDAQRPVVWNMGAIAASGHPGALALFRNVIMASSAIPGAFPPVPIEVEVDGKRYEELHVDGGTTREVFVTPVQASYAELDKLFAKKPVRRLYIVKNGKLAPEPSVVKAQTLSIASRAISTLIKAQNAGDIYRIWRTAKDGGADFNLIAVPDTFTVKGKEFFDPEYQEQLFEAGRKLGRDGGPWLKVPPAVPGAGP